MTVFWKEKWFLDQEQFWKDNPKASYAEYAAKHLTKKKESDSVLDALPTITLNPREFGVIELFHCSGLCQSKSEARRLVDGGGAYVNDTRVSDIGQSWYCEEDSQLILRKGKKHFMQVVFKIGAS